MNNKKNIATIFAILAAALYAINIPLSKVLLQYVEPVFMASFLYFGAGIGIGIMFLISRKKEVQKNNHISRSEIPFVLGMIILDIVAPICLMFGLRYATSSNASLLNNFEIVATSIIALVLFKEVISKKLWIAISFITLSSVILSFQDISSLQFSFGSLFVLGACVCWGLENNCTRMIANKSTFQIVILKGIFSGLGSCIVALILGESIPQLIYIVATLILGFVAYGLSIFLYIKAQKDLGAAKTSAYYAIAPFLGVLFSVVLLRESIGITYIIALILMVIGTIFIIKDTIAIQHIHDHMHTHTHSHFHDRIEHTHEHTYYHSHNHIHEDTNGEKHKHIHKCDKFAEHSHSH